jgi:hypothetical protein
MPIFVLFGAGAFLGLNSNIVALVPFSAAAAAAIIFTTLSRSFTDITHPLLIVWVAIQGGYMVGLTARELTERTRARLKASQSDRI